MFKSRKRTGATILLILLVSGTSYVIGVNSQGGNPTVDELLGIFNFPWLNATQGVNAPYYYQNGVLFSGGETDHGALTGLSDNDHGQYLFQDGSEELAGNWNAGNYGINASYFNAAEFYLDSESITDLFVYPEQVASYIIFNYSKLVYAKDGSTGLIKYGGPSDAGGGDGGNATDVIQKALDSGRVKVVLLEGVYSLGLSGITLKVGDVLEGVGKGVGTSTGNVTILTYSGNDVAVTLGSGIAGTDYGMALKNLAVLDMGGSGKVGILFINAYDSLVEFVDVKDFSGGVGIKLLDDGGASPNNLVSHSRIRNCDIGLLLTGTTSGSDRVIRSNFEFLHISGTASNSYGVYLNSSRYDDFYSLDIHDYSNGVAIYLSGESRYHDFFSTQIENCQTDINVAAVNRFHSFYGGTWTWSKVIVSDDSNYFHSGKDIAATEDMGTGTFPNGQNSYNINHDLGGPPIHVSISWKSNIGNLTYYWNGSDTQFTVNLPQAAGGNYDFSWRAWYQP